MKEEHYRIQISVDRVDSKGFFISPVLSLEPAFTLDNKEDAEALAERLANHANYLHSWAEAHTSAHI